MQTALKQGENEALVFNPERLFLDMQKKNGKYCTE